MTDKPATKPKTLRLEYVERVVPEGEQLVINDVQGRPEVQVLGVRRQEGAGFATFENVWQLCLVWR